MNWLALKLPALAFLFKGPFKWILSWFAEKYVGQLVDKGILIIDVLMIAREVDKEKLEYDKEALAAYKKATSKVFTEDEKKEIRNQYLRITRDFVRIRSLRKTGKST